MCALSRSAPEYGLGAGEKKSSRTLRWLYLIFVLLLGLASMSLATQRIALHFGYHSALGQGRTATLYDLCCMLADESRTIQDLFKEMVETDHAALLKELFPETGDAGYGEKAHIFIASSAREMLSKAKNEASGVVSTAITNLALYRDPVVVLNGRPDPPRSAD